MDKQMTSKSITVLVVCHNGQGEPDVFETALRVRSVDYQNAVHRKMAIARARDAGYSEPFICFDDFSGAHSLARIKEPVDSRFLRFGQLVAEIGRRVKINRTTLDEIGSSLGMSSHQLIETFESAEDLRQSVETGNWKEKVPLAIGPLLH